MRPVLVLGLDGATFDVIDPLVRAGRLPHLAAWLKEGSGAPLPSTVPAMTFPSWSSFLTGLEPGSHGMFDFTQKVAGEYRLRFTNATDRAGVTLPGRVTAAGGEVVCLGVPATWPPEPVRGLLVPGFDAPVSTGSDASLASDPALYQQVAARTGPWMQPGLDESAHADGWHERALGALLGRVRRKTDFACAALAELRAAGREPDLLCVVFAESDTVAHHFWRDHDPASPRHDPAASATRRGAVASVYEALDAACGELRAAFGRDAACFVVSDHGSGGAGRTVVQLNQYLSECGLARRRPRHAAADLMARSARDLALRALPPRLAQAIFRRARPAAARLESAARFGGFDWNQTAAFSEEANTQPGVWINAAGRERSGSVAASDYERVRDDVIEALLDWKLPGGEPVVARARPREDVYTGPFRDRAPDIVVELGREDGYALSLVQTPWSDPAPGGLRRLDDDQLAGGRGRGMNGVHRPDGIWLAHPGAGPPPASIVETSPAITAALGLPWQADGGNGAEGPRRTHTEAEEAVVADRLRALGYLE
ncbi:MAG: alkaline phosphatase family protein [Myxococcales bacterium]|nr:alkaline phosphatase family protein [Myxococcales bacterium]